MEDYQLRAAEARAWGELVFVAVLCPACGGAAWNEMSGEPCWDDNSVVPNCKCSPPMWTNEWEMASAHEIAVSRQLEMGETRQD